MTTSTDGPQRPSPELLRRLSDRRVFEQFLESDRLTRAEIAARTGISKPTVSDSVRRLLEAGLVTETGPQLGGRGRAGISCELRTDTRAALAVSIGPGGIAVDTVDLKHGPVAHVEHPLSAPVEGAAVEPLLRHAVEAAVAATPGEIHGCAVSVAGPVDRRTGRLVVQSYSPFLLGAFDPGRALEGLGLRVEVDNDVNWAGVAEHRRGGATDLDDFFLGYFGAGIGGSLVVGGTVIGGAHGMAGELARVPTAGPDGRSLELIDCFAAWGLLEPGTEAIDVPAVRDVLSGGSVADRRRRDAIGTAVAGALGSVIAVADPQGLLIGGPWGDSPEFLDLIAAHLDRAPHRGPGPVLRRAALTEAPDRIGARLSAVESARRSVIDSF